MNEQSDYLNPDHITYAELKERLDSMTPSELKQTATVYVPGIDEFYGIKSLETTTDSDVLDDGHIYLEI